MATTESDICAVGEEVVAAWNTHDMSRFSHLFCEDADFVNVYGSWWTGRERIEAEHVSTHATVFRRSRLSAKEMRVRFLSPQVVSLHMLWELTGLALPSGQGLPDRKGILVYVMVKEAGRWRIAVGQNTDIVPAPT